MYCSLLVHVTNCNALTNVNEFILNVTAYILKSIGKAYKVTR